MKKLDRFASKHLFQKNVAWILACLSCLILLFSNRLLLISNSSIWFDQQRLGQLILWTIALLAAAFTSRSCTKFQPYWHIALVIVGRAALAAQPAWALAEAANLLGLVLASWWGRIVRQTTQSDFDRTAMFALVGFCLANSIIPLFIYYRILADHIEVPLSSIFYGFSNHRFFTQMQVLTIPMLALPTIVCLRAPSFRYLATLAAILCWSLTFATGTRAVYVAMLGGSLVAWFWLGPLGKAWVKTQTRYALMGWVSFVVIFQVIPWFMGISFQTDNARLGQIDSAFDSSGRLAMWQEVLQLIAQHPLWGIGPMQYAALPNRVAGGPHNIPLQFLLEWGIPLGGVMIAIPLIGLWKLGKSAKEGGELAPLRTCLFITLLVAAIDSLFEGIITVPYSAVLLSVIVGWAWGTFPEKPAPTKYQNGIKGLVASYAIRAILLFLGLYLAWFAIYPIDRIRPHNLQYLEITQSTLMPRMWAQGLINLEYDDRYPGRWFKTSKPSP